MGWSYLIVPTSEVSEQIRTLKAVAGWAGQSTIIHWYCLSEAWSQLRVYIYSHGSMHTSYIH
jgi:hypothetical protein